jgi:hypothetical protein
MAMKRTLLVLGTIAWVAPLSAHQGAIAGKQHSGCPYERARAEAAARAAQAALPSPPKVPTTITLTDRVPSDSSLLGWGGDSGFLKP